MRAAIFGTMIAALIVLIGAPCAARPFGAIPSPETADPDGTRPTPPDYSNPADWACRPGAEERCTQDLDAIAIDAAGRRTAEPFHAAADPPIDCFYVYPTVSRENRDYADLTADAAVMNTIRMQAGRLATHCRLFVPLYRQATLRHLHSLGADYWEGPYQDISAAFKWYLAHDNEGRGVVLVGHSQGTLWLQRLIAEHIDGTPVQNVFVSAFLAGNRGLEVPPGKTVGGTFKHIPVCASAAETGCAYVWSSYLAGSNRPRVFGLDKGGLAAACTNPAKPGGKGTLDAAFAGAQFPGIDAPVVVLPGQIGAACRSDGEGSVLRVTVLPGVNAASIEAILAHSPAGILDWGLHVYDIAIAQGSMLKLIDAESEHWVAEHRPKS